MPTIVVGILTFMSRINFVLSWVGHGKSFINSVPYVCQHVRLREALGNNNAISSWNISCEDPFSHARIQKIPSWWGSWKLFLSHRRISQSSVRTSLEKQLGAIIDSRRGFVPIFLRKHIATCDFPGVQTPCHPSGSAHFALQMIERSKNINISVHLRFEK